MENHHRKSPAISALTTTKAKLLGELQALKLQARRIEQDIAALDRTMALLDPDFDAASVKAKRTNRRLFRRGELLRAVYKVLKESGRPMSRREIALVIAAERGIQESLTARVKDTIKGKVGETIVVDGIGDDGDELVRIADGQATQSNVRSLSSAVEVFRLRPC